MAASATTTTTETTPVRILIINPNTSTHMTDALRPVVEGLGFPSVTYAFFTSPSPGISSINSPHDASSSSITCLPSLIPLLAHHDAFLVACYSAHPLVPALKRECAKLTAEATRGSEGSGARKYVTGIFEASVSVCLSLIADGGGEGESEGQVVDGFGIVSTGKVWEQALETAVNGFLAGGGKGGRTRFLGCETTGLNASELHNLSAEEVRKKMMDATKRLIRLEGFKARGDQPPLQSQAGGKAVAGERERQGEREREREGEGHRVKAICLGCAGMVGLEDAIRTACVEELGPENGKEVHIVDGVKAGVGLLYGLARSGF